MYKNKNLDNYSLTKIVATLGPSTDDPQTVRDLIDAGMSVARINCSHGDWEERKRRIQMVREISKDIGHAVGILIDLQGPKIRTGTMPGEGVRIENSEIVKLVTEENLADYEANPKKIYIKNYPELPTDVKSADRVLLDDGMLRMEVLSTDSKKEVECKVTFGGLLKSNKGLNLPDSEQLKVQALTPKDKEDIIEAVKLDVDFIALSFVRRPEDIIELKDLAAKAGHKMPIKTIAKIEKPQALEHLDRILDVCEGVMVARGDLGVELDSEKVPTAQKTIIAKASEKKKIVITATQMMDSMVNNPFPTRAEVSDVANAILDGTDAVMLSNETAAGKYPVQAVDCMRRIALEIESHGGIKKFQFNLEDLTMGMDHLDGSINKIAIAQAVENFAKIKNVKTIVSFSCSGSSVHLISKLRPNARIIAPTTYQHTYNYLSLVWGVTPMYFDRVESTTQTMINLEEELISQGIVQPGETIIITGGLPIAARSSANFVKMHQCDGSMKELIKVRQDDVIKDLGPTICK